MSLRPSQPSRPWLMIGTIAVQAICAVVFVVDVVADWIEMGRGSIDWHLGLEITATASLIVAIVLEAGQLRRMLLREAHMARSLSAAGRALHDIMEEHFAAWRLTPSEQDVATFLVKGADIAEIARLRGSAEGTVKAHLNAIYRKAGVSGRPGLLSLLIEDLMSEPLIELHQGAAE
jgi:DNA-binding CsgD family transcriptional regulator